MKLYYAPGACSLAAHIVLFESQVPCEFDQIDSRSKVTQSGLNYLEVNPHGYVPALALDSGEIFTELPVILQYIADLVPDLQLVPARDSMDRYRIQVWLNYITSEIHKGFGPLFADDTPIHYKPALKDRLRKRFDSVARHLETHPYLMGERFTIADAHLWVMVNWTRLVGIDPDVWPSLVQFQARVRERPSVIAALRDEDLAW